MNTTHSRAVLRAFLLAAVCGLAGCTPGPEVHTYTTREPYLKARMYDAIHWSDRLVVRQVAVTYLERVETKTVTTQEGETTSEKSVAWDVSKTNQVLDWMSQHLSRNNWGIMFANHSGSPWLIASRTIGMDDTENGVKPVHKEGWACTEEQVSFDNLWQAILNAAYFALGTSQTVKMSGPVLYRLGTVDQGKIANGYFRFPAYGALQYELKGRPEFATTATRYSPVGVSEYGIVQLILPGVGGLMLSLFLVVIRLLRTRNSA